MDNGKRKITAIAVFIIAVVLAFGYQSFTDRDNHNSRDESTVSQSAQQSGSSSYGSQSSSDSETYLYDVPEADDSGSGYQQYTFRNDSYLAEHYEKHKYDTQTSSEEEYLYRANYVINNDASLHKVEAEDGDDIFYLESTNEFVVLSTDGFIRTYFCPDDGKAYFDRQ